METEQHQADPTNLSFTYRAFEDLTVRIAVDPSFSFPTVTAELCLFLAGIAASTVLARQGIHD